MLWHHALLTTALFSFEIRLCLKVRSRLALLQPRASRSLHYSAICQMSLCYKPHTQDGSRYSQLDSKEAAQSLNGSLEEKDTTCPGFVLLPGLCSTWLWPTNMYVYFVGVLLITIMIAYYGFQGNSCHCNASLPTPFPFSC